MSGFVSWGVFTPDFADELAAWLAGKRVLEVMAGNGLLASLLSARGVEVRATSLFASHDGHRERMWWPVEEMDAVAAVREHGGAADALLVSWPTTSECMTRAALAWGGGRPIVFIGEITDPGLGFGGLSGCASDSFFAIAEVDHEFGSYRGRSRLDRAAVMRLLSP